MPKMEGKWQVSHDELLHPSMSGSFDPVSNLIDPEPLDPGFDGPAPSTPATLPPVPAPSFDAPEDLDDLDELFD